MIAAIEVIEAFAAINTMVKATTATKAGIVAEAMPLPAWAS